MGGESLHFHCKISSLLSLTPTLIVGDTETDPCRWSLRSSRCHWGRDGTLRPQLNWETWICTGAPRDSRIQMVWSCKTGFMLNMKNSFNSSKLVKLILYSCSHSSHWLSDKIGAGPSDSVSFFLCPMLFFLQRSFVSVWPCWSHARVVWGCPEVISPLTVPEAQRLWFFGGETITVQTILSVFQIYLYCNKRKHKICYYLYLASD